MRPYFFHLLICASFLLRACGSDEVVSPDPSAYTGSGSISQGMATTTTTNLLDCQGGRVAGIGTVEDTDGQSWTVPAAVNFTNGDFPFASDLHNPCSGVTYTSAQEALAALDGTDIIEIDAEGAVYTAYIFADNYFEMYVNGTPVGKDRVPFTQFNSHLVRFKVNKPFTVAMKLVDWEENLGLGSEDNQGSSYHPGDGGMVAVIHDASGATVAVTDSDWKAQTFYTAPIKDLTCLSEEGSKRISSNCDMEGTDDGSDYYAIHWELPSTWMNADFDDSDWPSATTYTNSTIGVDNKESYTLFTDVFDASNEDAQFIWSENVVLDNEVIVRQEIK